MRIDQLRHTCNLDTPVEEVFAWDKRPGALERLIPPWEAMRVVERTGGLYVGGRVVLRGRVGPFPVTWEAAHTGYEEGEFFRDEIRRGPFLHWVHMQRFSAAGPGRSILEDTLGGRLGSGAQAMNWISLDDALGAIHHACRTDRLSGPVNAVAPDGVTNREFTAVLGKILRRPALLPVPAFAARLAFGEMANDLLLTGARVRPSRLLETEYAFRHPDLEVALRHLLGVTA